MAENAKRKGKSEEPFIPPYLPADAVSPCAQPGYKAGNPLIDRVNDNSRKDTFSKKFKKFYDNFVRRKK